MNLVHVNPIDAKKTPHNDKIDFSVCDGTYTEQQIITIYLDFLKNAFLNAKTKCTESHIFSN